jgi:Na+/proline symporter
MQFLEDYIRTLDAKTRDTAIVVAMLLCFIFSVLAFIFAFIPRHLVPDAILLFAFILSGMFAIAAVRASFEPTSAEKRKK